MKSKFTRFLWTLAVGLFLATAAHAQTVISGRVTDAEKNQPVPGATILIKGRTVGAVANARGEYTLSTSVPLPFTVVISSVGYAPKEQQVTQAGTLDISLTEQFILTDEVVVSASRVEESITKAAVTVEKLSSRQFQQSPAATPFDALQNVKGVDLLTQSLSFKSVNIRGFGANNNNRFVQLTDGMDNRSPGLGFGFGTVAGISDLDVESIEIIPGASSALYGPDALQGLMLTTSKNPFLHKGLSAQIKVGANNFGKENFGPKGYYDVALRYANQVGERFAYKVNFQRLEGTDFIADDYSDRSTRSRLGFWATEASRGGVATGIAYQRNNDPNTNLQYDGVNIYGDDVTTAQGVFRFPANFNVAALANRPVTRTGYTELDVLGNNGRVFSNRANVSLHYKVTDRIEASLGWYYGGGNLIRTAGFREYFPNYQRHQIKAELRGDNFFLRAYTTQQQAEGWNIGQTAININQIWKPMGNTTTGWARDFAAAFAANGGNIGAARAAADQGRILPGSDRFNDLRDAISGTFTTDLVPGLTNVRGTRFRDNSQMFHYEGMYNFRNQIKFVDLVVGASLRRFLLESGGTLFPRKALGNNNFEEYTINEYGAYAQVSKEIRLTDQVSFKPTVALRWDKNQYLSGGITPRASAVLSVGPHNFRASWQSAFRNPSPNQLFSIPPAGAAGEVGGLQAAVDAAGLTANPGYLETEVQQFVQGSRPASDLRRFTPNPADFTTEKIQTWEIGYKALINNKLYIDAFLYRSQYSDFIAAQNVYQLNRPGDPVDSLRRAQNYRVLAQNFNNFNDIFVRGWGLEVNYVLPRGFNISANYTRQVGLITLRDARGNVIPDLAGNPIEKRRMSNPEVSQRGRNFFISPENRYNITFGNPRLTPNFGFNITYRWTDEMWVEQGNTQGDVWLPSWTSLDAQVSYRLPKLYSIVKLGGSNILNQYYAQGYGLARIGGMYYLSLTFDQLGR